MCEIIVYHGSVESVVAPVCKFGRPNLDFGQGFYVTNLRQQAVAWANNISRIRQRPPYATYIKGIVRPYYKICAVRFSILMISNGLNL